MLKFEYKIKVMIIWISSNPTCLPIHHYPSSPPNTSVPPIFTIPLVQCSINFTWIVKYLHLSHCNWTSLPFYCLSSNKRSLHFKQLSYERQELKGFPTRFSYRYTPCHNSIGLIYLVIIRETVDQPIIYLLNEQ